MNKYIQNDSRSLIETILVLLLLLSLMLALYDVLKVFFGVLTFALIHVLTLVYGYLGKALEQLG